MKENIERSREIDSYEQLVKALDQEDKILREMRAVLERTPDRAEAERIILNEWASRMDSAMNESREAMYRWLAEARGEAEAE
jgi:hypothetical protein